MLYDPIDSGTVILQKRSIKPHEPVSTLFPARKKVLTRQLFERMRLSPALFAKAPLTGRTVYAKAISGKPISSGNARPCQLQDGILASFSRRMPLLGLTVEVSARPLLRL